MHSGPETELLLNFLGADDVFNADSAAENSEIIKFISTIFSAKFFNKGGGVSDMPRALLAPRELEALRWIAIGFRPGQVSEKMGLSDWTVREYLASATKKLSSNTLHQALSRAISWGILRVT